MTARPRPTQSPTPQSNYLAHKTFAEELKLTAELLALGAAFQVGAPAGVKFFERKAISDLLSFPMQVVGYVVGIGAIVFGIALIFTALIRAEWVFFGVQKQSSPSGLLKRAKSWRFWVGVVAGCVLEFAMLQALWVTFTKV